MEAAHKKPGRPLEWRDRFVENVSQLMEETPEFHRTYWRQSYVARNLAGVNHQRWLMWSRINGIKGVKIPPFMSVVVNPRQSGQCVYFSGLNLMSVCALLLKKGL